MRTQHSRTSAHCRVTHRDTQLRVIICQAPERSRSVLLKLCMHQMRVHSVQQNGWRSATDIAIDGMGTPRIEVRPKHEALPSFTGERKNVAFRVELLHHLEDGTSFAANVPILLDVKEGLQRRNCVFSRGGNLKLSD